MISPRGAFYYLLAMICSFMTVVDAVVNHDSSGAAAGLFVVGICLYVGNLFNRTGM